MNYLDAHAIHARLGANGWREVLLAAGINEKFLRNKHGPCPACGGSDRFRFDNKNGRGDWICNQCGAGDGFKLLMGAFGLRFPDARRKVLELAGITEASDVRMDPRPVVEEEIAKPTRRVLQLIRETCAIEDCEPVRRYMKSRALWPLPERHSLRAHTSVEYWNDRVRIGRYPALVAVVRDMCGEVVTAHVTYLDPEGRKLEGFEPRKILSSMKGREGCAVPLMPHGETLGIAEGIETALSAAIMHEVPTWAALNTALLAKFEPPQNVKKLIIFADRDIAGLDAAAKLMERLQGRVKMEIRTPKSKDWNDALRSAA